MTNYLKCPNCSKIVPRTDLHYVEVGRRVLGLIPRMEPHCKHCIKDHDDSK